MVLTKRTSTLPLICQICGDTARGINFEVMSCMSCKAFFRRHALQTKIFECQLGGNCQVTKVTRGICLTCRLKKCFLLGMNPKLIRYPGENPRRSARKKNQLLPKPLPLNLLQNDSSTLTKIEWNLLSNILHIYDDNSSIPLTKSLLDQQSSLPPKLRSKSTITLDIIGVYYTTMQSFLKRIPLFNDLSIDARRTVIQHNSELIGAYNSMYIVREIKALDSPAYCFGCCNIYGHENMKVFRKFVSQLEQNNTVFKILLLIAAFSGNCSLIVPDDSENLPTTETTIFLNHTQEILVTMLWKYLNYQYGFGGAVKCFNAFIKFILNLIRWIDRSSLTQHSDMIETIIENTARSLTIDDHMID